MGNDAEGKRNTASFARMKAEIAAYKKDMAAAQAYKEQLPIGLLRSDLLTTGQDALLGLKTQRHLESMLGGKSLLFQEPMKSLLGSELTGLAALGTGSKGLMDSMVSALPKLSELGSIGDPLKDLLDSTQTFRRLGEQYSVKITGLMALAKSVSKNSLMEPPLLDSLNLKLANPHFKSPLESILTDEFVDHVIEQQEDWLDVVGDDFEEEAQELLDSDPGVQEAVERVKLKRTITPMQQLLIITAAAILIWVGVTAGVLALENALPIIEDLAEQAGATPEFFASTAAGFTAAGITIKTNPITDRSND